MTSLFSLPENFIASSTAFGSAFFNDIKPLIYIIVGLGIAFIIIDYLIDKMSGNIINK